MNNPIPWPAAILLLHSAALFAQQRPDLAPYLIADRTAEIELARSAAPPAVSDSATVMVLTASGYTQVVRGSNGFVCLVLRSFSAGVDDPHFWMPRGQAPNCFNPPAARTVLPAVLRQVDLAISGTAPAQIPAAIARAYASHELVPPAAGAMTYMLSRQQYLDPDDSTHHWLPHLMFFYDHAEHAVTWGASGYSAPIIDFTPNDPHEPFLTLLIPVRRWSDGTPATQ